MRNIKLLVLVIAAFGLINSKRMFRKCTFCRYFYATGHSPYELLWILTDEISAYLSEDQRITLFLDEEDLTKAELVFETFCEKTCNKNPLLVISEAVAEVTGTGPRSASRLDDKAFYEPYDSEMSPEFTMPERRTLFERVKNPSYSERTPSAEMPAGSSGTTRKEKSDRLERTWREESRKHSGEYEISGTLLSNGSPGVHSGSAETGVYSDGLVSGNDAASDEIGVAVADSESEADCRDPACGYYLV